MVFGSDLVWAAIDKELCQSEITLHTYIHACMHTYIHVCIHATCAYMYMQIAGLKVEQIWPAAAVEHASVKLLAAAVI